MKPTEIKKDAQEMKDMALSEETNFKQEKTSLEMVFRELEIEPKVDAKINLDLRDLQMDTTDARYVDYFTLCGKETVTVLDFRSKCSMVTWKTVRE